MICSHIGKKLSDEAKKKVSIFNKGKIVSEETKLKHSIAAKNSYLKKLAIEIARGVA